ncbi:cytochrome c-type biogenesis protein CcmH [Thalassotalea sp. M1531]|uniref:Cytochrome c-type biogenesis protein n=1 Tax=Thalassotalea algicola TaxID=2716224 RepID=A0A7Y0L9U2_9GAMM|nr:cytochrome c-type biogenesis protein [Thalassotalea algicola]NMP30263.1 cytochrome c-type biogenesis protein CcmH [Thalassotalea algicola]
MLAKLASLFLVLAFGVVSQVSAMPSQTVSFDDPVTEKRYQSLIKELRCPKCQNQNLADSNSQIAVDLRNEVYAMLKQGKADMEITQYMVERYGEFVLYRPKISGLTYVLWFGPAVILLIGVIIVVVVARKKSATKKELALSDEQQQRLSKILEEKE